MKNTDDKGLIPYYLFLTLLFVAIVAFFASLIRLQ
jgi:hypothetical protein